MNVELSDASIADTEADLRVVGLLVGDELPAGVAEAPGGHDAKAGFKKTTVLRPDPESRWLVVGLGKRQELDAERLRVAAAVAAKSAADFGAGRIAWSVPAGADDGAHAAAIVEGTVLASYSFDRYRSKDAEEQTPAGIGELVLTEAGPHAGDAVEAARVAAEAENRARDLQSLPANVLDPDALAERAREIATANPGVEVTVIGRDEIAERGMGGLAAVASGSEVEPRLIALRYSGGGAETIGLVGKGVTFDSGGISIKPGAGMHDMKMDMSGAAAVLEAFAAVVELGLSLELVAVVPATENMPSGSAMRPGDIITQLNGKTVEVNNTDAEGRLILADALTYCVRDMGADRVVDIATLTGAVVVALGSTYAALISNDDDWAATRGRCRRGDRRACLAPAPAPRVQGADDRQGGRPHQPRLEAQGGHDLRRPPSSRSSSTKSHGSTWTSPAPPGTPAASTSAPAHRASACASSLNWPAGSPPRGLEGESTAGPGGGRHRSSPFRARAEGSHRGRRSAPDSGCRARWAPSPGGRYPAGGR